MSAARCAVVPPYAHRARHRERLMIESLDTTGRTVVSTVKWNSLCELGVQLF